MNYIKKFPFSFVTVQFVVECIRSKFKLQKYYVNKKCMTYSQPILIKSFNSNHMSGIFEH